ncbi:hypothetical protein EG329_010952 [Mollisiaceae sp. DMI_Dod_QoI]|nr:hypothetical protein EG329_010952 [Helotiales sp. DMI_Dod_QoI]
MRFFPIAAVFLAGTTSIFATNIEERDNTIIIPIYITSIIYLPGSSSTLKENKPSTITSYHTIHHKGFAPPSSSISLPPLKPFTKIRKPKPKPTHTPKIHHHSKHARDVTEIVETVHDKDVQTERVQTTVQVAHTVVDKHKRPKVTGLPDLHAVNKKKHSHAQKQGRAFGVGWFA